MNVVNGSGWFSFSDDTMLVDYYTDTFPMTREEMLEVRAEIDRLLELENTDA